jgi:HSP20 family protein
MKSILNIDLVETETEFQVHADLPGVEEKDLDISVENNHLVIKGQREKKYESNSSTEHRIERSYGSVQRSIRLPPNADQSSCNANFDNGVLTVTLTKMAPPVASNKIQVNANKKLG